MKIHDVSVVFADGDSITGVYEYDPDRDQISIWNTSRARLIYDGRIPNNEHWVAGFDTRVVAIRKPNPQSSYAIDTRRVQ